MRRKRPGSYGPQFGANQRVRQQMAPQPDATPGNPGAPQQVRQRSLPMPQDRGRWGGPVQTPPNMGGRGGALMRRAQPGRPGENRQPPSWGGFNPFNPGQGGQGQGQGQGRPPVTVDPANPSDERDIVRAMLDWKGRAPTDGSGRQPDFEPPQQGQGGQGGPYGRPGYQQANAFGDNDVERLKQFMQNQGMAPGGENVNWNDPSAREGQPFQQAYNQNQPQIERFMDRQGIDPRGGGRPGENRPQPPQGGYNPFNPGGGQGGGMPGKGQPPTDGSGGYPKGPGGWGQDGNGKGNGTPGQGGNGQGNGKGNGGPQRHEGGFKNRSPGPGRDGQGNGGKKRPALPKALQDLPLSAEEEGAVAQLDDELTATLASLGVQRDQIGAMKELITERLQTDQDVAKGRVDEGMIERGIFDSGVRNRDQNRTDLGFTRQRQDVGFDFMGQLANLASQEGEAQLGYNRGLSDIYSDSARNSAASASESRNGPRGKKKRGRRGKKGKGGGKPRNKGRGGR